MAIFKFIKAILTGEEIQIYNFGNHSRDFTYIDDVVEGVVRVLDNPAKINCDWNGKTPDPASSHAPWRIYNIGNSVPIKLMDCIAALEKAIGRKAKKEYISSQLGDVADTWANMDNTIKEFNFKPNTLFDEGIKKFVEWYRVFYKI